MTTTPSQIRAEDDAVPDLPRERGDKERVLTKVNVAGQQALPLRDKEEVNKGLWIQLNRQEQGHVVQLESCRTNSQRQERVRGPMTCYGKAALTVMPKNSHNSSAAKK